MATDERSGDGSGAQGEPGAKPRPTPSSRPAFDRGQALDRDQTSADADQTSSDTDQTLEDADQTASGSDANSSARDQVASDRDQATADREHDAGTHLTAADETAYNTARDDRETTTLERLGAQQQRSATAGDRDLTALDRDRIAEARDKAGNDRDVRAAGLAGASIDPQAPLEQQLEAVLAQAAADRARAAADRERAALDRSTAARERARLEAALHSAHLDELTGAFRREMGGLALSNEIARARRSDGRFVVAFVDVDGLKIVNDQKGHAAGDRVLQAVVRQIRARLRSFDPIIRYGGDEFVCGIGGTDLEEAGRRFEAIAAAIQADAKTGISVGLATLAADDTPDGLIERADVAMLKVKENHHLSG